MQGKTETESMSVEIGGQDTLFHDWIFSKVPQEVPEYRFCP
jgi:hypothetical protein